MKIASIVEGDGEVEAFPLLLKRLAEWRTPTAFHEIARPIRVQRDKFINREEEFERHLLLAAHKSGTAGWIVVLLDLDDGCAVEASKEILFKAKKFLPHRRISVVLAVREYEAWFIAAARSLQGKRGFVCEPQSLVDAETPRNAKGWIKERMAGRGYGETIDQPAFTAVMSLEEAHANSRSFRKLCAEWDRNAAVE